ncbi:MAG TPA: diaminopimelate epimerase, partial [Spirochaetota bacterium]|nr:diaminopimelate epimerase [Spirochaetota bacterium]
VTVDMGMPILERSHIPMIGEHGSVIDETIELEDSVKFNITAVSMGNPHAVIFVEDLENFPLAKYGQMIENHPLFPHKTNVEFVKVISKTKIEQRTWERGAGETLACGTGASAAVVASHLNDKTSRKATVKLRGGDLNIEWNDKNGLVYMTGPAVEIYRGVWPLN